jgi:hypothetical protein
MIQLDNFCKSKSTKIKEILINKKYLLQKQKTLLKGQLHV